MNLERRLERLVNLAWQGGVDGVSDVTDAEKQLTQSIVTDVMALVEAARKVVRSVRDLVVEDSKEIWCCAICGNDWDDDHADWCRMGDLRDALAAFEGIPNA